MAPGTRGKARPVSLESLMDQAIKIIKRDLKHIYKDVRAGKLESAGSRDIVQYLKVLADISERQRDGASALTETSDEELKAIAKDLIKKT